MLVEQLLVGRTFEPEALGDDGEPVGDRGIVPLTPTLSREGRGSQKSLRPRVLLRIQGYCR